MIENNLNPSETRSVIEKEFDIEDLSIDDRRTYVKTVRHLYMYFALKNEKSSLEVVSREIGRVHACAINSRRNIQNAIDIKDEEIMPLFERALNVIKLHQTGLSKTIEEIYEYHIKEAQKAKEKIEVLKLEKKQLVEKIKPHNLKTKEAQKLADNLITKSVEDFILRRKINNWLSTKKSTDLLECTKHIEYNHSENFNVFSELHRSIQL